MKTSKPSSRVRNGAHSVKISSMSHGLTSQAGLIPVVKYLDRIGFEKTVKRTIAHPRGDNADYHLSDAVLLTLVGMRWRNVNGKSDNGVWADRVLRKVAGLFVSGKIGRSNPPKIKRNVTLFKSAQGRKN